MLETKVCIIGSGPAGAVTSLFLSKYKIPHILVERDQFPRNKVCGECYDGRVINVLNDLDEDLLPAMYQANIISDIWQHSYFNSKKQYFTVPIPETAKPRISTKRSEFDLFLQQQAIKSSYTTFLNNQSVHEIEIVDNKACIKTASTNIVADITVVATGSNSPLMKKILPANNNINHFLFATRAYYKNLSSPIPGNGIRIHFIKEPVKCYLYFVEIPNGITTVELFVLKSVLQKTKYSPEDLFMKAINSAAFKPFFEKAELTDRFQTTSLPYTFKETPVSAAHVLAAGSSALTINPATGLGVGQALLMAQAAAKTCADAVEQNNFSRQFLKQYDDQVYKAFRKEKLLGQQTELAIGKWVNISEAAISVLSKNKWLAKKVGDFLNKV